ncbi:ATP-binding cassette domain-containing protein [Pararhizobium sp. LjRoot235]|uniref:ABC transporter ATP-binding protein n=1 Tax=Pararhizobium sp. LjRoot235 TaxID=3342291 RepID=UPI003ECC31FD
MISIDDVTVTFGGVTALSCLTVTLDTPVFGIIGPNGAGKTTFLNVLSGFVTPRSGRITMDGTDILRLAPHLRARWGLRRSFQKEQVVDELSVEDNVRVVLDPFALSANERERALMAALEFVGLSAVRGLSAAGLNAFERRMVEIARCIIGKPKLILLDEPGAGFSQGEVDRLRQVINGIRAFNGATTLLIDHDVDLIQAVCQDTMVLDFGSLIAVGATATVLRDPKVRAVYLGMEEMAA